MNHQSPNMARAELLISQDRFDLAEEHLRLALAEDPQDAHAHALLALCLENKQQFTLATNEAQHAIGLEPEEPFFHFVLARIFDERHMPAEAEAAIRQSLELNPLVPSAWAVLAGLRLQAKKYKEAIQHSERGLEIDPEHTACLNIRAMAQQGLGLNLDAERTIEGALRRRPDDPFTHANMGWSLLHQGEPHRALEHFRESLRLEPGMEWARQGIVEAMKARFFLYRWILAYFLWMQRLPGNVQWFIIIGAWFASRAVRSLAKAYPSAEPVLMPLLIAYFVFCATSWLAVPLFNLILRLDRFGRLVLSRAETIAANLLGLALVPTIVTGLGWAIEGGLWEEFFYCVAPFVVPVAIAGNARPGAPRIIIWSIAGVAVACSATLVALALAGRSPVVAFVWTYMLLCLFSPLLINLLHSTTPAKRN